MAESIWYPTFHNPDFNEEKHFCPTMYLETTRIILFLLSGLVFSNTAFENNVPICFLVGFFFLIKKI